MIATVPPPRELTADDALVDGLYTRVSSFMSVFDVHINRTPIAGTVNRVVYIPGKFLTADPDKAREHTERQNILVEVADGLRLGVPLIAAPLARRIVPVVKRGKA